MVKKIIVKDIKSVIATFGITALIVMIFSVQVKAAMPDNGFIPIQDTQVKQSVTEINDNSDKTNERQTLLTSAPEVGSQLAKILIDETINPYNNDGTINRDNFTPAYKYGNVGQCAWYASGRFYEAIAIDPYTDTKLFTSVSTKKELTYSIWLDNADREDLISVYSIRDPNGITPQSIAVWDRHVVFVEYVEYNNNGNPTEVYFSESNYDNDTGHFRPGIDGVIKKQSFNDFINRSIHGNIKGYIAAKQILII